ncbi:hypothetical protein PHAVU_009G196600 [Phaseolus vulgaris]|uniref:SHSP domain-containing protein n=1 Tax=Phaseolus vulgaris TaxID=3885 RepID=V7B1F2_PHAVU|nr:hypothetical protein PHAVU_009G196600g [Phaseolus vulgaris]ESW10291.1 hypothetical protein PHAVU_009G196600g [Phaseolus vulgaris]
MKMSLDEKTNAQAAAEAAHEDFQPPSDWDRQQHSDTLILMLPGFRKEQLKVQVSNNRVLRLSGERKISENKWRRFRKEEPLSDSHDTSGINAKFEAGMLYVKLPKVIKPQPPPPPLSPTQQEPSKPHQPTTTITDDKKQDAPQQHDDEKDPKEDKTQESKIEEQPPPPQEPKEENEDSREMPQKEMSKVETEEKRRTSEAHELHETTQTAVKERKEGHEDSEKKVAESGVRTDNEKKMGEVIGSNKSQGSGSEGLSKTSVAKMNRSLDMISDMVLEVKKQNKVANLVVLVFLVLLIGLYLKSVVKSSFGGPKNQEL